jgi:hypothetical protein
VLRLSSLYAAFDCSTTVRVDHLRAALALWDYCFASARYILGDATGNPIADRIREALRDAGEEGLTRHRHREDPITDNQVTNSCGWLQPKMWHGAAPFFLY